MIVATPDDAVFPENVIKCLKIVLPGIDPEPDPTKKIQILSRPLRPTDPQQCIGLYGTLWAPEEDSYEMGHVSPHEATLNTYQVGIQTLVKDSDTERGLATSSILTRRVRSVIYRNEPLRLALGQLYVADDVSRESMRRWGIRNQRFMSNDIEGTFVTISVLDLWLETEMS
jgi:hypothetical protein